MEKNDKASAGASCKKVIEEYIKECMLIKDYSDATLYNKRTHLTLFAQKINKPFDEMNKNDIKEFIADLRTEVKPSTLSLKKSIIKQFFKWYCNRDNDEEDEITEYPPIVKWIRTSYKKMNNRNPNSYLDCNDVEKLIEAANTVQHKAIIAVLWDTAARQGELLNMNINDIHYDSNGLFIHVSGKTGQRMLRFIHSKPYLSAWLETHPYKDKHEHEKGGKYPLWTSNSTQTMGKRLSQTGLNGIIHNIVDRTDIEKHVTPHSFRHGRLTDLARKGLNESYLRNIAGWTGDSSMPKIYIHMSGEDGANKLLELEETGYVKPKEVNNPLEPVNCRTCGEKNGSTNRFCSRCGMLLNEVEFIKSDHDVLKDPISILSRMKKLTRNYEAMVDHIWDILKLKDIMASQNQITKLQLKKILGINNFEQQYNDWLNQGFIQKKGNMVQLPVESKQFIEKYAEFWRG